MTHPTELRIGNATVMERSRTPIPNRHPPQRSPVTLLTWKRSAHRKRRRHEDLQKNEHRTVDLPVLPVRYSPFAIRFTTFPIPRARRMKKKDAKRTQFSALALSKTRFPSTKRTQTKPPTRQE